MTQENLKMVIEFNTYGGEFFSQVKSLKLHEPKYWYFDNVIFAKFRRESKDDFEYGIRWNAQNKKLGVKSFADLVTSGTIVESHYQSIEEYLNFGKMKNGTYAAQYGHDDLTMGDVSISHFIKSNNLFSNAFLNGVKEELRILMHDEDLEIKLKKEEELRRLNNVYIEQGYKLRQHADFVQEANSDIYLMMM